MRDNSKQIIKLRSLLDHYEKKLSLIKPLYTSFEMQKRDNFSQEIKRLRREISHEEDRWRPSKGKLVKISKAGRGRKDRQVPVGIVGLISNIYTNNWGTVKTVIIDNRGQKWWPSLSQIEVIDPDPDTTYWDDMEKKNREANGLPAVVTVTRLSNKAALVKTTRGDEFWIPFSQVSEIRAVQPGQTASVMLPMWLAKHNGLVGG